MSAVAKQNTIGLEQYSKPKMKGEEGGGRLWGVLRDIIPEDSPWHVQYSTFTTNNIPYSTAQYIRVRISRLE